MRRLLVLAAAVPVAAVLTAGVAVLMPGQRAATPAAVAAAPARCSGDACVAGLQARLRRQPGDTRSWAALATAYVELARGTGQPSYYPRAEQAVARALTLDGADDAALGAAGLLAAARHDFGTALRYADRALAANPYSAAALNVRTDALVELGRYAEATSAARTADGRRPGLATFLRLSYLDELRGRTGLAAALLRRGLEPGNAPSDVAFCRYHLGELARTTGDYRAADREYAAALKADPAFTAALAGRARVRAADGDLAGADRLYRQVVATASAPQYATEYGELLAARGDRAGAQAQYALVRAAAAVERANGVVDGLELAVFEADHGNPANAVALATAEWSRRRSIHAADALGWALHAAGRDSEALRYARLATRLGTRDAHLLYHRGMIERGAGQVAAGRRTLRATLALDPGFSPLAAPAARAGAQ